MNIGTNTNFANQVPSLVTINDTTAVKICDADLRRIMLSVALPCTNDTLCVIVSPTEQNALDLEGETLYQNFIGADNPYLPRVVFDTDSSSQGEKWAILDPISIPTSVIISVNEYIA